jgi:hypothetical protein
MRARLMPCFCLVTLVAQLVVAPTAAPQPGTRRDGRIRVKVEWVIVPKPEVLRHFLGKEFEADPPRRVVAADAGDESWRVNFEAAVQSGKFTVAEADTLFTRDGVPIYGRKPVPASVEPYSGGAQNAFLARPDDLLDQQAIIVPTRVNDGFSVRLAVFLGRPAGASYTGQAFVDTVTLRSGGTLFVWFPRSRQLPRGMLAIITVGSPP